MDNNFILQPVYAKDAAMLSGEDYRERRERQRVKQSVERVLDWLIEQDLWRHRSPLGRMAIDETRVDKRTSKHKELYTRPEIPSYLLRDGVPMPRVAPLSVVVQVVKSKSSVRSGGGNLSASRVRQLTVATLLATLRMEHSEPLLRGARLRQESAAVTAQIERADRQLGSASWSKSHSQDEKKALSAERAAYARRKEEITDQLVRLVRTRAYKDGWKFFDLQVDVVAAITGDDVRAIVFAPKLESAA